MVLQPEPKVVNRNVGSLNPNMQNALAIYLEPVLEVISRGFAEGIRGTNKGAWVAIFLEWEEREAL